MNEEMKEMEDRLTERIRDVETTLLREFRKWATRTNKADKILVNGFDERLTLAEERLDNLETKQ